jgi:hypothetical protein
MSQVEAFSNPAAGVAFSTAVPTGKTWQILGGSYQLVCSATVASRNVGAVFEIDGIPIWSTGTSTGITASQTRRVVFYPATRYMAGIFYSEWVPIAVGPQCPLPAGTDLTFPIVSIQAGDQVSEVRLLVEEADA